MIQFGDYGVATKCASGGIAAFYSPWAVGYVYAIRCDGAVQIQHRDGTLIGGGRWYRHFRRCQAKTGHRLIEWAVKHPDPMISGGADVRLKGGGE